MTRAQVSGSLLLRIYSVTAYGTTASSSISSTALARLTLRQRCAAQYVVTACVCKKGPVIVLATVAGTRCAGARGVRRAPSPRKPDHAAVELSARCAPTAQEGSALRRAFDSSFLDGRATHSARRSTRLVISATPLADVANQNAATVAPGAAIVEQQRPATPGRPNVPKDDLAAIRTIGAEVHDSLLVRNSWTPTQVSNRLANP
jgi:ribose 5-phosphate isomerase RpiB